MKTKTFCIGLILSIGLFTSCDHETIRASGEVTSREISFSDYSGLKVANAFNVFVTFSNTEERIRIDANENIQDRIIVQKECNDLIIKLQKYTNVKGNATLNAYITTNKLSKIDISGATDLTLENEWVVEEAKIKLSGASDFSGEIMAERLNLDMGGASSANIYGSVNALNADLSGSSDVRDFDLVVERLDIELSGASEAFLSVNESIDIKGSGASVLYYKGNAIVNNKRLSGASEIKNRN